MYSYYAAYLIGARHQSCEGKILLVHPFICAVSPSLSLSLLHSLSLSLSRTRAHALCEVTIPFRELSEHTL